MGFVHKRVVLAGSYAAKGFQHTVVFGHSFQSPTSEGISPQSDAMSKGKLYGNKDNFRTLKVLIAAKLGNFELQLVGEHPPADKFPLGIVCFLDDICAEVVQWIQWAEGSLLPTVLGYVLPSVSAASINKKVVDTYKAELFAQLAHLNQILLTKTYLVGERFSIADISVALDLLPAFQHVLDVAIRKKFGNVTRWFQTILHHHIVKEVVGEVHLCEKVSQFNSKLDYQMYGWRTVFVMKFQVRHSTKYRRGVWRVYRRKMVGSKKNSKSTPKPNKVEMDDDDGELVVAEKTKDPFDVMPKGNFVMDSFKRVYSNEDTATEAIPYFWNNFDADAYSIWFCEYKYPTELTLTFMSCNLISEFSPNWTHFLSTGMYQRLEKLKKNAFASMVLFGTDNNSSISGIWIWRGQDLAFTLSPDWQVDYESYTWTKLDPKDEKTKKVVNEYLMWEGDFDGKKFNQGKIFK
uniref:eEF-1B gamma n=1 Tax=Angiostrongylus cantonensis TaxID=6313 RepID=A0A0K0DGU7_ANGCA